MVYADDGTIVVDPDEEVRAAVADVFALFDQHGSALAVVRAFAGRRFPRRDTGVWDGRLAWGRLTHGRAAAVLKNPVYAGAYVFGRSVSSRKVRPDGTVVTAVNQRSRDQWAVLICDHHEGYISWQQYLQIEAKLAANRTRAKARPPREGVPVCQGIIFCGSCGFPMSTRYRRADGTADYVCTRARSDALLTPGCHSIAAASVDPQVVDLLLAALTPEQVDLALAAADEVHHRHQRSHRAAELAVERARYEANRAERAFGQVEPENRLVARSLESRWEAKLAALAQAEAALADLIAAEPALPEPARLRELARDVPALWRSPTTTAKDRKRLLREHARQLAAAPRVLTAAEREAIRSLADDLPGLWHAPSTTMAERKQLIRLLIERIAVRVMGDSEIVEATITWAGGRTSTVRTRRPVARVEQFSYYPQLIARIRELSASGLGPRQIAEVVNAEGYRTAKRNGPFSPAGMNSLLRRQGLLQYPGRTGWAEAIDQLGAHEWFLPQLAAELDMPQITLHGWIGRGWVNGRRDRTGRLWILHADPGELAALRERRARPNGYYTRQQYLANQEPGLTPPEGEDHAASEE
jgi:hypothetical protein